MRRALFSVAKWAFQFLTVVLAVIAGYQLASDSRSAPYFLAPEVYACSELHADPQMQALNDFLVGNIRGVVYLNLLVIDDCEDDEFVESSGEDLASDDQYWDAADDPELDDVVLSLMSAGAPLPDVVATFRRDRIDGTILAFIGEPGIDIPAERIRGLFFPQGEIEGGVFHLDMLPVPFSEDMLLRMICSESLAQSETWLLWLEAYVRSCIFEQPWDPWGWSNKEGPPR